MQVSADDQVSADNNVDPQVARGFGEEWSTFRQDEDHLSEQQRRDIFDDYFRIFPVAAAAAGRRHRHRCRLRHRALVDAGGAARRASASARRQRRSACGGAAEPESGGQCQLSCSQRRRHARCPRRRSISPIRSACCITCRIRRPRSTPSPAKLKPGAPFLVYLYYALDNRPAWYRALWRMSNVGRLVMSRLPHPLRFVVSQIIAALVYWPLARTATLMSRLGRSPRASAARPTTPISRSM